METKVSSVSMDTSLSLAKLIQAKLTEFVTLAEQDLKLVSYSSEQAFRDEYDMFIPISSIKSYTTSTLNIDNSWNYLNNVVEDLKSFDNFHKNILRKNKPLCIKLQSIMTEIYDYLYSGIEVKED